MQAKFNNCKYPLVSIFCSCKNRAKTIRRCIDSILAQDYPKIEIIVQDGASTDGTLEILCSYGDKIKLVSEPDSSPGEGLRRALMRITGEFWGSCLSDEELLPHAVSWAVENLTKYPKIAAIYGDHYLTDIDGNITGEVKPKDWNFEKYFCSEWTPPFCASFFRTSCCRMSNYTGVDEFDFWISLAVGFPIRHVPGLVSKYAIHPGQNYDLGRRFASRKAAIEKFCSSPETPEWIRSLRDKAIASLYTWLAIGYSSYGVWDMAKKTAPEAFRVGPNPEKLRELAELLYRHGMELYQEGQLEQALEYLDLSKQGKDVCEGFNYQRAEILLKLARINEAAQAAYEELKLQPDHRRAKAIIRQAQSCPDDTVQSPNDKLAKELFKTGINYLSQGIASEAIQYFEKAIDNYTTLPNLYYALATAYVQLGYSFSAKKACEIELSLQPDNSGVRRLLERIEKQINESVSICNPNSSMVSGTTTEKYLNFKHNTNIFNNRKNIEKYRLPGIKQNETKSLTKSIEKSNKCLKMQVIGSEYGGWAVDLDLIPFGSTIVSAGVGEDISFDSGLIKLKNCRVIGIDPTEKARRYIENNKNEHFDFLQKALYFESNKKIRIYKNTNPNHVSESITPSHKSVSEANFYEAETISIEDILNKYKNVSVLKMDIEGAEYEVLNSISKLDIPQICIEFHHFCTDFTADDTEKCIERLSRMGYVLAHCTSECGAIKEATFLHRKYIGNRGTNQMNVIDPKALITALDTSQKGLFAEDPQEIIEAKELIKLYYKKRLKDIWFRPDHPVWFDHEIDYHLWPDHIFWIERGVFGRIVMKPGCRVLDLCCGDGYYSDVWYSTIAATIDACDNNRDALHFALLKHSNPKIKYYCIDILQDPFPSSKYDVVTWFGAIEHFTEEQIIFLLTKIKTSMDEGGILVGSTPLLAERTVAGKKEYNRQHEREFASTDDLEGVLRKVFAKVQLFVSNHADRKVCNFQAVNAV